MNNFTSGFMSALIVSAFTMILAVYLQVNYVDKNKLPVPIVLQCPDNSKQIIIPDASKMEL